MRFVVFVALSVWVVMLIFLGLLLEKFWCLRVTTSTRCFDDLISYKLRDIARLYCKMLTFSVLGEHSVGTRTDCFLFNNKCEDEFPE